MFLKAGGIFLWHEQNHTTTHCLGMMRHSCQWYLPSITST